MVIVVMVGMLPIIALGCEKMQKLKNYNGRFCEQDFEDAFLTFLEDEGWHYLAGSSIPRSSKREVLYSDDLCSF